MASRVRKAQKRREKMARPAMSGPAAAIEEMDIVQDFSANTENQIAVVDNAENDGDVEFMHVNAVRRGDIVLIKGHACKIEEYLTSKPGKHGHARIHFVGRDLFSGKKREEIYPTGQQVEKCRIVKNDVPMTGVSEVDNEFHVAVDQSGTVVSHPVYDPKVVDLVRTKLARGDDIVVTVVAYRGATVAVAARTPKD